ncbi:Hypothetical predicted protein [Paramuricea clavata]|uniref:QRICH1-like domain-containing protein n=1 Tax=Paramuricea clavata TaxID=317549 RepID=A0A6S7HA06_PARCT|nr:Hypothetical predicted protein [Paramuricea clavata]
MAISVKDLERENEIIIDELKKWREDYKNLKEEKEKLYSEMLIILKEKDEEISNLNKMNKELEKYIDCLERKQSFQNHGKDVSQVSKKSRTLNTFMSQAKVALWLMKSFGLELKGITAMEQNTGTIHSLHVDDCQNFDSLSNEDKEKIEQILFLLDKFCVGDSFYHELTMITDGLPKSYLVKQRRSQLNDISNVIPTPDNRFRKPITSLECKAFKQSWMSDGSRRKWITALKAFKDWQTERNVSISKDPDSDKLLMDTSLEEMSDKKLDHFLGHFVAEVRKVNGKEYPGKTIYEMIDSIQTYVWNANII